MKDAIEKASILVEALGYIQSFRNRLVVIKLGGSAMAGAELTALLTDVVFMEAVGMRPVLVHGGGPAISKAMKDRGKEPVFVNGRRVTDAGTLEIVKDVLVKDINRAIVEEIRSLGGRAQGIHPDSNSCVVARQLVMTDPASGDPYDLGLVGEVSAVKTDVLRDFCEARVVPVIAPLGVAPDGQAYNINGDSVASGVAIELQAEKLVYLSDTHGIYTDANDETSFASHLSEAQIKDLVTRGVISKGMLPKVEGCLLAVKAGVRKAHIIDGRIQHSLLLEIFTSRGIGTEIVLN
ncbi:MAG TPA: acetylglutamate kinase [Planctomycetota bacterium]|nr:acetylglutamate kinase [Planctomycetota bacterium]HUV38425.1 acetylglutamate kinase [Planctomycetota bacterium]